MQNHNKKLYSILVNSFLSFISLIAIGYGSTLLISDTVKQYVMPSWTEIIIVGALPLLLACASGLIALFLLKWDKNPNRHFTTFFTVLWAYFAYEILRTVLLALRNLYSITIPDIISWVIVTVITLVVSKVVWTFFQTKKLTLRTKLAILIPSAALLYILLPVLAQYVWRLTYVYSL